MSFYHVFIHSFHNFHTHSVFLRPYWVAFVYFEYFETIEPIKSVKNTKTLIWLVMAQSFIICLGFSVFQWKNKTKMVVWFSSTQEDFYLIFSTYNWLVVFLTEPNNAGYNGENCGQFLVDTVSGKNF